MKLFCFARLAVLFLCEMGASGTALAQPAKIINFGEFGVKPNSGVDATRVFQQAFAEAQTASGPVVLQIPKGQYELFSDTATKALYVISNTRNGAPSQMKVIGLYLKGIKNFTIEGNDSLLRCHGKMTMVLLDACENVTLHNLHFDWVRPTVSELTVAAVDHNTVDFRVHPDSKYKIDQGKVVWTGEDWQSSGGVAQEYDPISDTTWRCDDPIRAAKSVQEAAPNLLRMTYDKALGVTVGHTIWIRDGVRDEVGMFIFKSHNTSLKNIGAHFMHGLGIVGQQSDTITLDGVDCSPRAATGRTCAGFADFMHFSACCGKISVRNCNFSGAQDDAINIHGVYLQIQSTPAPNQVLVAFKNSETFGFTPFSAGDKLEFVRSETLIPFGTAYINSVKTMDEHQILLTLDQTPPSGTRDGIDVVENTTLTPEIEIKGCHVSRIPTRGFLLTSRRKTVVENNTFTRLYEPSILISDDASDWFESGTVRDVTIQGNHFVQDSGPVIQIAPSIRRLDPDASVHENIAITKNVFYVVRCPEIAARATKTLKITENTFSKKSGANGSLIDLSGCRQVSIDGNISEDADAAISIHQMKETEITVQPDFRLSKE